MVSRWHLETVRVREVMESGRRDDDDDDDDDDEDDMMDRVPQLRWEACGG